MQLTKQQEKAVTEFSEFLTTDEECMILTGGSGTGKTFVLKKMLAEIDLHNIANNMAHCEPITAIVTATTNKAVEVLQYELIHIYVPTAGKFSGAVYNVVTVFKALGLFLVNNTIQYPKEAIKRFTKSTVLIIDEFSYIDDNLLSYLSDLVDTSKGKLKILFIGDANQLKPVGLDEVPVSTIKCRTVVLDQILRQQNSTLLNVSKALQEFVESEVDIGEGFIPDGKSFIHYDKDKTLFMNELTKFIKKGNTKYISYTNADVSSINKYLFKHLKGRASYTAGDILVNNSYFTDIRGTTYKSGESVIILDSSSHNYVFETKDGTVHSINGTAIHTAKSKDALFIPPDYSSFNLME